MAHFGSKPGNTVSNGEVEAKHGEPSHSSLQTLASFKYFPRPGGVQRECTASPPQVVAGVVRLLGRTARRAPLAPSCTFHALPPRWACQAGCARRPSPADPSPAPTLQAGEHPCGARTCLREGPARMCRRPHGPCPLRPSVGRPGRAPRRPRRRPGRTVHLLPLSPPPGLHGGPRAAAGTRKKETRRRRRRHPQGECADPPASPGRRRRRRRGPAPAVPGVGEKPRAPRPARDLHGLSPHLGSRTR